MNTATHNKERLSERITSAPNQKTTASCCARGVSYNLAPISARMKSTTAFRRRVQVPLPKSFCKRIEEIQGRLELPSNSAVIQVAMGLLIQLISANTCNNWISVEDSSGNRRDINPLVLLGDTTSGSCGDEEGVVKYQLLLDPEQDDIMRKVASILGASTIAEMVRWAVRVLHAFAHYLKPGENLIMTTPDGEDIVLNLK